MAMSNADIAAAFERVADLLELRNANPFRVRAYRNAARVVGELKLNLVAEIVAGRSLPKLPGIGADLGDKIRELATTGHLALLDRLVHEVPAGLDTLLQLPGLGPKRVRALYEDLHVHTLAQLRRAAHDGRIRALPGFGAKTEERIAAAIDQRAGSEKRFKLVVAAQAAEALLRFLRQAPGVKDAMAAGSLRRRRETVGDLDVLVTASDGGAVCRRLAGHPEVAKVLQAGDTRASVVLGSGLQVDLRVVPPASCGAALIYFTGSKAHNIRLRNLAIAQGMKLNEYGLFEGGRRRAGATEQEVYAELGLPWIAPELREDRGEIEATAARALPTLVERADLRGDLHVHSDWSDGHASLQAMAEAARAQGLQYIAITDHSRRIGIVHGLDAARLARQRAEVARLNESLDGITLLSGIEVDILDAGALDLPDDALAPLDLVVAAVHSRFNLPRARQTERVLAALDRPQVRILAHPLGRLIDERDPYDIDMLAVVRKCEARGVALELNAHPQRLDLSDIHCRMARDEGVPVAIDSDAHAAHEFDHLEYGIGQARRGWLDKADVLNTRPLDDLRAWLARPRP